MLSSIRSRKAGAIFTRGAAIAAGLLLYACNGTEITGPTATPKLSAKGLTAAHQFGTGTPVDSKIDVTIFYDQGFPIPMPGEPGDPPPVVGTNSVLPGTPLVARIHVNAVDDGHGLAGPISASQGDPTGFIAHTYDDLVSNEQGIVDVPFIAELPAGTWAFNASFDGSERNGFSYQPSNTSSGYNVFQKCPKTGCGVQGPVPTSSDAAIFLDLGVPLPPPGQGFPAENLLPPNGVVPGTPLFIRVHVQARDGTNAGVAGPVTLTVSNPDGSVLATFPDLQTSTDGGVVDVQITSTLPPGTYRVHVDFLGAFVSKLLSYAPSSGDNFFQVYVPNKPPVARTAGDITVRANLPGNPNPVARATLDGSASFDADGQIVEYSWYEDFPNGTSAPVGSGVTVNNIFGVGDHTIRLHIRDNQNATAEATFILHVLPNAPPVAVPGPDKTVTANGPGNTANVSFDGSASFDPDGSIVEYSWFEDTPIGNPRGAIGNGPTPQNIFSVGDHIIRLHVRDNVNQTNDATLTLHVLANQPPISRPGNDRTVTATGPGGANVSFDGSASSDPDGTVTNYQWFEDFTNGTSQGFGGGPNAQRLLSVGDHKIRLRVFDNSGNFADASFIVHVLSNQPPVSRPGPDKTVTQTFPGGANVSFDGSASSDPDGTITNYQWFEDFPSAPSQSFGGGTAPTAQRLLSVGDHRIRLRVFDNAGNSNDASLTVHVLAGQSPVANFGGDRTVSANQPGGAQVTFDGSASTDADGTINFYSWFEDLPNGTSVPFGGGSTPTATSFFATGDHRIRLVVKDNTGLTGSASITLHVVNLSPVSRPGSDQTVMATGPDGASISLDGSASSDPDGTITQYIWFEMAGGVPIAELGNGPTLTHVFSVGDHSVMLRVKDNGGASNDAFVTIHVKANTPPTARAGNDQTLSRTSAAGANVSLNGSASSDPDGFIAAYDWSEGGVSFGSSANVSRLFSLGDHVVRLRVTDNGGLTNDAFVTIHVLNVAPVAIALSSASTLECVNGGGIVQLDGSRSSDVDGSIASYDWTSSAGNASGANATLSLPVGETNFTLTVRDNDGASNSTNTSVRVVDTRAPSISMSVSPDELWSPNHKMVKVASGISASDACGGASGSSLGVTVSSNQPLNGTGDGTTSADWQVIRNANGTYDVYVRSERAGTLTDRIYTITAVATDATGNTSTQTGTVTVPHNK